MGWIKGVVNPLAVNDESLREKSSWKNVSLKYTRQFVTEIEFFVENNINIQNILRLDSTSSFYIISKYFLVTIMSIINVK